MSAMDPTIRRLVRTLAAVNDAKARVALARVLLGDFPPDQLEACVRAIQSEAALRDPTAQVALLAIAEARVADSPAVGRDPTAKDRAGALSRDDKTRAPDWGMGRPLTLGERKNLARRPDRRLLEGALRDGHPDVIDQVLQNPRLTEADLVRMCAAPGANPVALARVFTAPRWAQRPRVRRALALNRATPVNVVEQLLPLLTQGDLREIAGDARLDEGVRARARELLREAPRAPDEITGE